MNRSNQGRHLPAFILLFLATECMHGLKLVNRMNEEIPNIKADGPAIYRALSELEKEGALSATWDTTQPGAARKCYEITEEGRELLRIYKGDIEQRKQNLDFFLEKMEVLESERK